MQSEKHERMALADYHLHQRGAQTQRLHVVLPYEKPRAQRQHEQLAGENRILKRAVAIQDNKLKDGTLELKAAHSEIERLREELRQAQQLNFALTMRFRNEADGGGGGGFGAGFEGGGFDGDGGFDYNTDNFCH